MKRILAFLAITILVAATFVGGQSVAVPFGGAFLETVADCTTLSRPIGSLCTDSDNGDLYKRATGPTWTVTGAQGPQGDAGLACTWEGTWSAGTDYGQNECVFHGGSSYISDGDPTTGDEPGVDADWDLIAQEGAGTTTDLLDLVFVEKTSDESVNNTGTGSTLQADDELFFAVGANEVWVVDFVVYALSSTTVDLKISMTSPTGTTGLMTAFKNTTGDPTDGNYGSNASTNVETGGAGFTAQMSASATGTVLLKAILHTAGTSGNVTLMWAQNAASATNATVFAKSHVIAQRFQ